MIKDFGKTGHNVLLQDAEGVSNMFDDNHQNVKLNALSFITSDILIYCFKNNPGEEALEVAQKMDTIMKAPKIESSDKDKFNKNKPYMIIIVNKCDSANAYQNDFDIFDEIIKNDQNKRSKIEEFRSRFIAVKSIGLADKGSKKRGPQQKQECQLLHNCILEGLNKKAAIKKRTPTQIGFQMKNTIDILKPLNVDFGDLNYAFILRNFVIPELRQECDNIKDRINALREDVPCGELGHQKEQFLAYAQSLDKEQNLKSHGWNIDTDEMVISCCRAIDGFVAKKKLKIRKKEDAKTGDKQKSALFGGGTTAIGTILLISGVTTAGACVVTIGPFLAVSY